MKPQDRHPTLKLHPRRWTFAILLSLSASTAYAIETPEILCMSANETCTAFSEIKNVTRSKDGDNFALTLLKNDMVEAALTNKEGMAPKKYSDELRSLGPAILKKLQRIYSFELVQHQFDSGNQSQNDCLQFKAVGLGPMLALQAMRIEKGHELYIGAVEGIKSKATATPSTWRPKYSLPDSHICMLSDEKIGEAKINEYVKAKGMKGYIEGLRPLTSEARLPLQYIGYLVYADGTDDYTVIQSFGNKAIAGSVTDSTPIHIDFGNDAPLSEGASLEGLYLRLIKIGPYETTTGALKNAFFFQAVDAPQIPRVVRLR